ncbi:GNAT family N-acetyltransferase [Spirosoma koreense]
MTFFRISQPHPYLTLIQSWYESAFPPEERRTFAELTSLLTCPDMHFCALLSENQLVGFIIYWQWEDIVFIEHFAIDPELRGKQLGQQALAYFKEVNARFLILEVELATDDISRRRIRFYERQGFCLSPFDYAQPPYRPGQPAVPMHLMSMPAIDWEEDHRGLSNLIKERVYESNWPVD